MYCRSTSNPPGVNRSVHTPPSCHGNALAQKKRLKKEAAFLRFNRLHCRDNLGVLTPRKFASDMGPEAHWRLEAHIIELGSGRWMFIFVSPGGSVHAFSECKNMKVTLHRPWPQQNWEVMRIEPVQMLLESLQ